MSQLSIKQVVAIGVGAALFIVVGLISIPTPIPNTSIQLQYAVQALLSVVYGPFVGFLIGFIGHAVKDLLQFGNPWWSWIFVSGLFGLIVGITKKSLSLQVGQLQTKGLLTFNLVQIIANIILWGLVAPVLDILIYQEAANKVFAQGIVAGGINALVVAIAGSLLLNLYTKNQVQTGSLTKE